MKGNCFLWRPEDADKGIGQLVLLLGRRKQVKFLLLGAKHWPSISETVQTQKQQTLPLCSGGGLCPSSPLSSENEEGDEGEEQRPQENQQHKTSHTHPQPTPMEGVQTNEQFLVKVSKPKVDLLYILQQGWDLRLVLTVSLQVLIIEKWPCALVQPAVYLQYISNWFVHNMWKRISFLYWFMICKEAVKWSV